MRFSAYILIFVLGAGLSISCSGSGEVDTNNESNPVDNTGGNIGGTTSDPPGSFSLTFPNNAEVCQEGAAVADQPDKLLINFKWGTSSNANTYEILVLESESDNEVAKIETSSTNQDVEVNKGILYKWGVRAINNDGEFSSSEWSFYSRGERIGNYVPYPAHNIELIFDSVNDLLTVQWEASDEDGDPLTFDISLFEDGIEVLSQNGITNNSITNIPVALSSVYYATITVNDGTSATTTSSAEIVYE